MQNRRDFFKAALLGACALAPRGALADDIAESARKSKGGAAKFNMRGFAAPKIGDLRIGVVGCGTRGWTGISRFHLFDGARTAAFCDIVPEKVERVKKYLKEKNLPDAAAYCGGDEEYKSSATAAT